MSDKRTIVFDSRNVWRTSFIVLSVVAIALLLQFLLEDGGGVIFIILMAWFASIAMEPAVARLTRYMKRGFATATVMLSIIVFFVVFSAVFGNLLINQIAELIESLPAILDSALAWFNQRTNSSYEIVDLWEQLNLTPEKSAEYASAVLQGVLGLLGSLAIGFFGLFTIGLFAFYLSADAPRFRRYIQSLFSPRFQPLAEQVWGVTADKTGSYVAARVVLALINGSTTAVVFFAIGMPSWLALGIWTGLVSQFVPTIGTYIAIALPVLIGLLSGNPWIGIIALLWGILYQQVENLTIEPRISARAVNVHPAVAFASVLLGAALFGVAGALLAVPIVAMASSIVEMRHLRFEVPPDEPDKALDSRKRRSRLWKRES